MYTYVHNNNSPILVHDSEVVPMVSMARARAAAARAIPLSQRKHNERNITVDELERAYLVNY